jgi:hypothetical protein
MDTDTDRVDESVFAGAPVCGYYHAVAMSPLARTDDGVPHCQERG